MPARNRWKKKPSVFTGLPVQMLGWLDWVPELLPLVDLPTDDNVLTRIEEAADVLERSIGAPFDGTATSVLRVLSLPAGDFAHVRDAANVFLQGFNAALFPLMGHPYPGGPATAPEGAAETVVSVCRLLQNGSTKLATRVKAMHLCLQFRGKPGINLESARAYLAGEDSQASRVRSLWSATRMFGGVEPDNAWRAKVYDWGLDETPCLPTEYTMPDRPAWPIPALVPVAEIVSQLYECATGIFAPMTLAKGDVAVALLERARQLTERIKDRTHHNDGLTAEILMRCLADTGIQFRTPRKARRGIRTADARAR